MPYITSIERYGMEQGLEQGLQVEARLALLEALEIRLGTFPDPFRDLTRSMVDVDRLRDLRRRAYWGENLEQIERELESVVRTA